MSNASQERIATALTTTDGVDVAPAVLHLRRGDPLPQLPQMDATPTLALAPGTWTLLVSVDEAAAASARAAADAALGDRRGINLAILVRGAGDAVEPPYYCDTAKSAADRLGALADASGARAALLVLVEPRQTVQASVVGCDAAAFSAVLAAMPG